MFYQLYQSVKQDRPDLIVLYIHDVESYLRLNSWPKYCHR